MKDKEHPFPRKIDLSHLGTTFSSKPVIMGGLAMEYYGIGTVGMTLISSFQTKTVTSWRKGIRIIAKTSGAI